MKRMLLALFAFILPASAQISKGAIAWRRRGARAPGMKRFHLLRETLESLPYWKMEPANHLAAGGPCLARPGNVYAVFVEGRNVAVNLTDLDGEASAEWVNTWTGDRLPEPIKGGSVLKLNRPPAFEKAPALLIVRRAVQTPR